jgi:hypothetical protein
MTDQFFFLVSMTMADGKFFEMFGCLLCGAAVGVPTGEGRHLKISGFEITLPRFS